MPVELREYQDKALTKMHNGCILNGGVGSGKSRTALAYYYNLYGGQIYYYKQNNPIDKIYNDGPYLHGTNKKISNKLKMYVPMKNPPDLYIITTAMKRDSHEWELECAPFLFSEYNIKVTVDSWNNIKKYADVKNAFFIFDEQRVVGYGVWVKTFLEIAKANQWILLSATPGDRWEDYIPVFIANGFIKNKSAFQRRYEIVNSFNTKYRQVTGYVNEGELIKFRRLLLIKMDFERTVIQKHEHIVCNYNEYLYDYVKSSKWNVFKDKPIENSGEYCNTLRRIVNESLDKQDAVLNIVKEHPRAIIFYNYDYELFILRKLFENYPCYERNGHKHDDVPEGDKWVYLVQYASGAEAWNCITTNCVTFFSMNYAWKVMEQASGRINRMNTPFQELYYYHLRTEADIDVRIRQKLRRKEKFNEDDFAPWFKQQKKKEAAKKAASTQQSTSADGGKKL